MGETTADENLVRSSQAEKDKVEKEEEKKETQEQITFENKVLDGIEKKIKGENEAKEKYIHRLSPFTSFIKEEASCSALENLEEEMKVPQETETSNDVKENQKNEKLKADSYYDFNRNNNDIYNKDNNHHHNYHHHDNTTSGNGNGLEIEDP